MRERIQRRKKKAEEQASQPAPPPLQPAYFDEAPSPAAEPAAREVKPAANRKSEAKSATSEIPDSEARASETQTGGGESLRAEAAQSVRSGGRTRRGRRRRGGRGRGGRGREQAAGKGIIHEVPAETPAPVPLARPAQVPGEAPFESAQPEGEAPAPGPGVSAAVPAAEARPPKGIVVLAIGLPGSGKSSWFKRHNVVPLSSDMVRTLLFDDVREQRYQDLVFSNLRSMLKARLIAKRPMNYVDATNLTPQERAHWIKLAKDYNYEVHAVFFDVPLAVCIERHQRRDRVVPEDVMRRMAAKLKPPSFSEGIAKITVVRVKKKEGESSARSAG